MTIRTTIATALLFGALLAASAQAPAEEGAHPELDKGDALTPCQVCHADVTPDIVNRWWTGPHGKFNVKCFVCHGALEGNFDPAPKPDFCVSCHGDQVESMADDFFAGKSCFDCHPQHLLVPHLTVQEYQGGRR